MRSSCAAAVAASATSRRSDDEQDEPRPGTQSSSSRLLHAAVAARRGSWTLERAGQAHLGQRLARAPDASSGACRRERRGDVPERVGVRVAERAVVGEDLDVVEAVPAGGVERARMRRTSATPSPGSARSTQPRVGSRRSQTCTPTKRSISRSMSSSSVSVFQRCQTSNWMPSAGGSPASWISATASGIDDDDRPLLAAVALVRLERDPEAEPLGLGGDRAQAVDDRRARRRDRARRRCRSGRRRRSAGTARAAASEAQ